LYAKEVVLEEMVVEVLVIRFHVRLKEIYNDMTVVC
jgi:hypothetical protein